MGGAQVVGQDAAERLLGRDALVPEARVLRQRVQQVSEGIGRGLKSQEFWHVQLNRNPVKMK